MLPYGKELLDYLEQKARIYNNIRGDVNVDECISNSTNVIERSGKLRTKLRTIDSDIITASFTKKTNDSSSYITNVFFKYEEYVIVIKSNFSYVSASIYKEEMELGTPSYDPIKESWIPVKVIDVLNKKNCLFNINGEGRGKFSITSLNEFYNLSLPLDYSKWTKEHCTLLKMVSQ